MRHARAIPLYVLGGVLALYGLFALAGAGGEAGHRADWSLDVGRHHLSGRLVGCIAVALAVTLVGGAVASAGRRTKR